eukprot:scaffold89993_cov23-Cyclotella_meneghiniana.AAC.1
MIGDIHNKDGVYKLRFSHPIRRQQYDPITRQLIVETDSVNVGEEVEIDVRVCNMMCRRILITCACLESMANTLDYHALTTEWVYGN